MTVRELIDLLGTFPPEMPVGYVNDCADDGRIFMLVEGASVDIDDRDPLSQYPQGLPRAPGAVVLG